MRANLLSEPRRTEIRNLLRAYVDLRLKTIYETVNIEEGILRSEEIQNRLWSQLTAAREKGADSNFNEDFVRRLDEVMNQHMWRVAAYEDFKIPQVIWGALYVIAALTMFSIGFQAGKIDMGRSPIVAAFILILSVTMFLIADLDNPNVGTLKVSQRVMLDLRNMMGA